VLDWYWIIKNTILAQVSRFFLNFIYHDNTGSRVDWPGIEHPKKFLYVDLLFFEFKDDL
jgi:hypothetical protein